MSSQAYLALILFSFVSSITPGPNNLMLLASGVNFGFRASIPHLLGVSLGSGLMVLGVGLGLHGFFSQLPWLYTVLKWVGVTYLLYLAWRIAQTKIKSDAANSAASKPLGFIGALLFQWVNPKVWFMAVSIATIYVPADQNVLTIFIVALIFNVVNAPCVSSWLLFGARLSRLLQRHQRRFNWLMAVLLIASVVPMLG